MRFPHDARADENASTVRTKLLPATKHLAKHSVCGLPIAPSKLMVRDWARDARASSYNEFRSNRARQKHVLRLISAVIVGTIISQPVSAQQYPIRLDLHEKAGLTYYLVATGIETTMTEVTASGQLLNKATDKVTVEIMANVTVVEAANGWATRKRFTIRSSKVSRGNRTSAILPDGIEVIALIQNGQTVYEVNNQLIDEETAVLLRTVIGLHLVNVGDDEMYGTSTPRRIGQTWPVNSDAVKKLLKDIGAEGGKLEVTGRGILERVENDHVYVRSSVNVKDVLLPIRPELTTESGEIQTELWGRFPVLNDDITREHNGTIRISRFASGVDPHGKKAMMHVVYESRDHYEIRPVQK